MLRATATSFAPATSSDAEDWIPQVVTLKFTSTGMNVTASPSPVHSIASSPASSVCSGEDVKPWRPTLQTVLSAASVADEPCALPRINSADDRCRTSLGLPPVDYAELVDVAMVDHRMWQAAQQYRTRHMLMHLRAWRRLVQIYRSQRQNACTKFDRLSNDLGRSVWGRARPSSKQVLGIVKQGPASFEDFKIEVLKRWPRKPLRVSKRRAAELEVRQREHMRKLYESAVELVQFLDTINSTKPTPAIANAKVAKHPKFTRASTKSSRRNSKLKQNGNRQAYRIDLLAFEKRVDPSDGKSYTKAMFKRKYGKQAIERWQQAVVV